jgi:hypothetical protein
MTLKEIESRAEGMAHPTIGADVKPSPSAP